MTSNMAKFIDLKEPLAIEITQSSQGGDQSYRSNILSPSKATPAFCDVLNDQSLTINNKKFEMLYTQRLGKTQGDTSFQISGQTGGSLIMVPEKQPTALQKLKDIQKKRQHPTRHEESKVECIYTEEE